MTPSRSHDLGLRSLDPAIGAEVMGVDLSRPLDESTLEAIRLAWAENLILLFRDQCLDDAQLVAYSRRFGDLDVSPRFGTVVGKAAPYPEVLVVSNVIEDGQPIGVLGAGEAVWHTDMSYKPVPPLGSALYALEVPAEGGRTGFINMYKAYESLPETLRAELLNTGINHDASTDSSGETREGMTPATDVSKTPGTVHPAVRRHPVTDRPALFLGRRRNAYVVGRTVADSEAYLNTLWAHALQDRFCWYHEWRVGDLLMWDNRCTMHRREPFDPHDRRVMHRTQIKGGPVLAAVETPT